MKKIILFVFLSISGAVYSQPCLLQGIDFTTQGQIDSFAINYPGCTEIGGFVRIGGSGTPISSLQGLSPIHYIAGDLAIGGNDLLSSLDGLQSLDSIGGDLIIGYSVFPSTILGNPLLGSMSGLDGLKLIRGALYIRYNDTLNSLDGLQMLGYIGGDLMIEYDRNLPDLIGLTGLSDIGDDFFITNCDTLQNLEGLHALQRIEGGLTVVSNPCLTSLQGLNQLNFMGGSIHIGTTNPFTSTWTGNPSLTSLNGLNQLQTVGGMLAIGGNHFLVNIQALDSLQTIGGNLVIEQNSSLPSLEGLGNIAESSIDNLYIDMNYSLTTCEVQSICDYLGSPNGTVTIHDNQAGCNDPQEVMSACIFAGETQVEETDMIQLFPNPVKDFIVIEGRLEKPDVLKINIQNAEGSTVKYFNLNQLPAGSFHEVLDLTGLESGYYTIRMIGSTVHVSRKLLLIR